MKLKFIQPNLTMNRKCERNVRAALGRNSKEYAVYQGRHECCLIHRITECSGLEGTSVGHLVQPSC